MVAHFEFVVAFVFEVEDIALTEEEFDLGIVLVEEELHQDIDFGEEIVVFVIFPRSKSISSAFIAFFS